ncbi:MAG: CDP-alcohol phosphatidyltransferase family protein [Candidatus Zhuqueibacterota bacterium]
MKKFLSWPNMVTVLRVGLLFFLVFLIYDHGIWARLLAVCLTILIIVMDWLDGFLARRLEMSTMFGSVLDIAGDRMIESVLWIIMGDLNLVPVWIPIVVISRDILTDTIRSYALRFGYTAFGKTTIMRTKLGRFLTGSPWMRTSYAIMKAVTFSWLLLISALDKLIIKKPIVTPDFIQFGLKLGLILAVATAAMCLVRGIPVIIEGSVLIQRKEEESAANHSGGH